MSPTGITKEMLDREGLAPREARCSFSTAVGELDLFSDELDYDRHWMGILGSAVGITFDLSKIGDFKELISK